MSNIWGGNSATLFAQTASVTISNSVTETTLLGSGIGSLTIPAGFFAVGKTLKINTMGLHSAAGNPTIRLRFYLNATALLDTTAVNTTAGTNDLWWLRAFVTCRSIGTGGAVIAAGYYEEDAGTSPFQMTNLTTIAINTTIAQTMNLTAQWGTASTSNSLTSQVVLIESNG